QQEDRQRSLALGSGRGGLSVLARQRTGQALASADASQAWARQDARHPGRQARPDRVPPAADETGFRRGAVLRELTLRRSLAGGPHFSPAAAPLHPLREPRRGKNAGEVGRLEDTMKQARSEELSA